MTHIFHSSRFRQDILRLERGILVVMYEKDIAEFVAKCLNCRQVKIEDQKPRGLAQNIKLPELKLEMTNMEFIRGLPRSCR